MVKTIAGSLLVVLSLTGCAAMREREWGGCAVAGGVIGAAIGGTTGGVVANNAGDMSNSQRGAAIGGGIVGGGAIGALLGHLICDPLVEMPKPPPPAPPPPPPPAGTKIEELKGANFDFNKYTLKPEGKVHVDHAVEILKKNMSLNVSVNGYTDSIGSDQYNLKLSERRAKTVADYMVDHGISASRIVTKGFGKADPVASNKTAEGRAENRRVEIITR